MHDMKMQHKHAGGIENAGLENAAQTCSGWKMQKQKRWHKPSKYRLNIVLTH